MLISKIKEIINSDNKKLKILCGAVLAAIIVIIVLLLCTCYGATEEGKFGFRVSVNGVDVTGLDTDSAAQKITEEFQASTVRLYENDSELGSKTVGELGFSLDADQLKTNLEQVKSEQSGKKGIFKFREDFTVEYTITSDDETYQSAVSTISNGTDVVRTASTEPTVTYDSATASYIYTGSEQGNEIDADKLRELIQQSLTENLANDFSSKTLDAKFRSEIYITVDADYAQSMQDKADQLNAQLALYRTSSLTYEFGSVHEEVGQDLISSWLIISDDGISLDSDQIYSYITDLKSKYDTIYYTRTFQTTSGESIEISTNDYGYRIDSDGEYAQLCADIASGTAVSREPVYSHSGYNRNGQDDLCGNYIEVSLSQQHLWLYKDGALVTETDIISGLPTEERETHTGAWFIAYKVQNYTLTSDVYGYDTDVSYWMPFVYGQGLHDAAWQTSFGGETYKTNGSHGCINLPPEQAAVIYENIEAGYPIIIY